jgi:hypothetical protein
MEFPFLETISPFVEFRDVQFQSAFVSLNHNIDPYMLKEIAEIVGLLFIGTALMLVIIAGGMNFEKHCRSTNSLRI